MSTVAMADLPSTVLDILVVDDESELREILRRAFVRDGHRVVAVADGRTAIDRASTHPFDVVLLDVALGGPPDGYEVCRTLRQRQNVVPVIMLTARDSEAELRSRIRAVLRRTGTLAYEREVIRTSEVVLDRRTRGVTVRGEPVHLTFSEFELLHRLMRDPGRLSNRQELLREIWGDSAYRDPRAIDVHIRHLRKKIEVEPDRPRLLLTVRGMGYRFREE